jgi:hypothetical protein
VVLRRRLRAALIGLLCSVCAAFAAAHPMPESRVWIDTTPAGLKLTLQLPLNRLEFAYGQPLADDPDTVLARHREGLSRYLLQHVGARSGDTAWQAQPPQFEVVGSDASAELEVVLELRAPAGADKRSPTLLYDAITHEVRTHRVQVFLRKDWEGGFVGEAPLPLGELHHGLASLPIPLEQARAGSSLLRLLQGGAMHIAQGTDHLLFLLMLVIVAPLSVRAGSWDAVRPVRSAARQIAVVVTAFTLGHSLTLALGSTGVLSLPSQPVEVAVAVSIAFAAIHAFRPLFSAGEVMMALGFGLVHGFAFSASLLGAGLTPWQHAQALLAFNLGIEAMQLVLLMCVVPALLVLCRTGPALYAATRRLASAAAVVLAVLWVVQRLGVTSMDATPWLDDGGRALAWIPGVLWLVAILSYGRQRLRAAAAPVGS